MIRSAGLVVAALLLTAGVASAEADISSTQEAYQIYRWKTDAPKQVMIQAATSSLGAYASGWQTTTPIVMDAPPPVAARFKLVNPLANSPLAGLAALGGASTALQFRMATCDGAVWISSIQRDVEGSQHLRVTACLFPSATGYDLDLYMTDVHDQGGGFSQMLGRAIAGRLVGSPEVWKDRLQDAVVADLTRAAGSPVVYVEGQPDRSDPATAGAPR